MEFKSMYDISSSEIYKLAVEEAKLIGKTFSKEEIEKLKSELLDPTMAYSCIYGLLTGNCNSEKANNFIKDLPIGITQEINMEQFDESVRSHYYMSPLEHYIFDDELEDEYDEELDKYVLTESPEKALEMIKIIKESANH